VAESAHAQVDAVERYLDVLAAQGEWFVAAPATMADLAHSRTAAAPRATFRGGEALAA
jgi:hypothetical protein